MLKENLRVVVLRSRDGSIVMEIEKQKLMVQGLRLYLHESANLQNSKSFSTHKEYHKASLPYLIR